MKPIGRIKTAPWLSAPETKTIVSALQAKGQNIRFVGGCVRDTLFTGPTPKQNPDIDIATPDSPQEVTRLLEDASIKYIPSGIEYGTITAVVKNYVFEITSLRTDVKTYGRGADVDFINDWMQDAARRDFTINAMMVNSLGDLYDPWNGIKDLEMGAVRFIGNANERIQEDHKTLIKDIQGVDISTIVKLEKMDIKVVSELLEADMENILDGDGISEDDLDGVYESVQAFIERAVVSNDNSDEEE